MHFWSCPVCDFDFTGFFLPCPDCIRIAIQSCSFQDSNLDVPDGQKAFVAESYNRIMDDEESEYQKLLKLDEDDFVDLQSKVTIITTSEVSMGLMLNPGTTSWRNCFL